MRNFKLVILSSFMALGFATLSAQPGPGMPMGSERAMEMIRTMRIVRMRERLALSEQQVASILPKLAQRDSLMMNYQKSQGDDLQALRAELEKRTPSEARLKEIMNRMKQRETAHQASMSRIREEIMSPLNTVQQAEFVIFEVEFEREIRQLIHQVRGRQRE